MPDNGVEYTGVQLQIKGGNGSPSTLADRELYIDKATGRLLYGDSTKSSYVTSGPLNVKYNGELAISADPTKDAKSYVAKFGCLELTGANSLNMTAGGAMTGFVLTDPVSQGKHNFKFNSDTKDTVCFMYSKDSKIAQFANIEADSDFDVGLRSAIDLASTNTKYSCYFGNTYIRKLRISDHMYVKDLSYIDSPVEGQLVFVIQ